MKKKGLILFFVFLVNIFFAFTVQAQIQNEDVTLTINPAYPRANENVSASLVSYLVDLNKANISWALNGKTMLENVGKKSFSFTVGNIGEETKVEANIQAADGSIINKKITINPSDIDLLWEATDSYVPPFYKGKALFPSEGMLKIVAMPNSSTGGLVYNWKQDGTNQPNLSGYGKNFYLFKNSYLEKDNTVEVTVSDFYNNNLGQGKITISPNDPKIVFYKKDPSLGILWENALSNGYKLNPNGETLIVEPYFFSPKNLNSSDLDFKWFLGGSDISTPLPKNELSIKPEDGQPGESIIKVTVENVNSLFQNMSKELQVEF